MSSNASITISVDEIEPTIKLHLNNAGASLSSQQTKYAVQGLISAAYALSLSELVLRKLNTGELLRFQGYVAQATKLVQAYWEDFGLVLLQHSAAPHPNGHLAEVQVTTATLAKPAAPAQRNGKFKLSADDENAIINLVAEGGPAGTMRTTWLQAIADDYDIALTTVYDILKRAKAKG